MRLTKKKAIEITKELWGYLAETGSESKRNWSGWKNYGKMEEDCPCCEYDVRHFADRPCRSCPLYDYWGDTNRCSGGKSDSPYNVWHDAETKAERKQAAQKIVDICDKALK